ncbi:MAG: hypothetical protein R2838_15585 [Caldilineaceae bacterium]
MKRAWPTSFWRAARTLAATHRRRRSGREQELLLLTRTELAQALAQEPIQGTAVERGGRLGPAPPGPHRRPRHDDAICGAAMALDDVVARLAQHPRVDGLVLVGSAQGEHLPRTPTTIWSSCWLPTRCGCTWASPPSTRASPI